MFVFFPCCDGRTKNSFLLSCAAPTDEDGRRPGRQPRKWSKRGWDQSQACKRRSATERQKKDEACSERQVLLKACWFDHWPPNWPGLLQEGKELCWDARFRVTTLHHESLGKVLLIETGRRETETFALMAGSLPNSPSEGICFLIVWGFEQLSSKPLAFSNF